MVLTENEATKRDKNDAQSQNKVDKKDKPATKVVIRRLPPSMTQEEFLNQVSPIPNYNYIYTIKGDNSLGGNAFARVYVNFTNQEDIYIFKEKFDNYVFIDGNGHEYAAVVEYASFQKVPKKRKQRADLKTATIESDPAYIAFLESLIEQPNQEEKPEYNLNLTNTENKNDMTTPLLDYLKQRKVERLRVREEKREERRKKEQEKKKLREEDRKKRLDEKKQKNVAKKEQKERDNEKENKNNTEELNFKETDEDLVSVEAKPSTAETKKEKVDPKPKQEKTFKNKKYDDKDKKKNKFKFEDRNRDVKQQREQHFRVENTPKPEVKCEQQKKVKKYSERREERKIVEASKEEAKRAADNGEKPETKPEVKKHAKKSDNTQKDEDGECSGRKPRENDPRTQRRIRNKDRPAMQIYKPGMLRKKSVDNDKDVVVEEKHDNPED
ncbi:regulator of nonsense transcripts 3A [Atheta coriaria]|uniref:regulator of nonsense transcripts 3A n=1 Tax=Dalotia coriaria TaxID=877792 RepID=UPI0031F44C05